MDQELGSLKNVYRCEKSTEGIASHFPASKLNLFLYKTGERSREAKPEQLKAFDGTRKAKEGVKPLTGSRGVE